MFGVTTFAQSTFAGLGIIDYVDSVSETISLTTIESVLAQFKDSCLEQVVLTDCQRAAGWIKINNNQQSYQPQTYSTEAISELAFAESSGKLVPAKIGWSPIYNDQTTTWNTADNNQTTTWTDVNDNVTSCC